MATALSWQVLQPELLSLSRTSQALLPWQILPLIKLKPAKKYLRDYYLISEDTPAFQENDIMMGI